MSVLTATARRAPEWLLGVGAIALFVFYYLLRADTVGVFSTARGWQSLTPLTLPTPVHYVASASVLGVLPVMAAVALTGRRPAALGLGVGDWRRGLRWLAFGVPLAVLAGWIAARGAPMRAVYPLDAGITPDLRSFGPYALLQLLYYGAWEVLFRGVLLFGLADQLGARAANMSQTALSVTAHFGRAIGETFAALPAGFVFGWVTLRIRSIWYIALIHWTVAVSLDWFILSG
jgi:membrane protease YdiL (CAAX protease family)